jgi:hypothetical protein
MWEWLNENSGAIQGLSAVVSLILTVAIIGVTAWYVRLTHTIAETTKRQLAATVQPVAMLQIWVDVFGRSSNGRCSVNGRLGITNKGAAPLKIKRLYLVVQHRLTPGKLFQKEYTLDGYANRVILPTESLMEQYTVDDVVEFTVDWLYGLHLVCSDLPELSWHEFFHHPQKGLRHAFAKPPHIGLLRRLRIGARRLELKLEQLSEYRSIDE